MTTNTDRQEHTLALESTGLSDGDPALLYLESLAPGSRRVQWSALRRIVQILSDGELHTGTYPWEKLEPKDVVALRRVLMETLAPATGRRYLSAFKAVIEYTYVAHRITGDRRDRLIHKRVIAPIRGSSPPPGRSLDRSEVFAFLRTCSTVDTASARRDAAMFGVMYCVGLRGREVINLDLEDVDFETGKTRIHGKGAKNRDVTLSVDGLGLVKRWVEVRGDDPGPLFVPLERGGGVAEFRRIAHCSMATTLRRRARQAGVKRFTPHDLRRTFVSDLLTQGQRLEVVAHACGHANVNTTARYERGKDTAADRMTSGRHLPH